MGAQGKKDAFPNRPCYRLPRSPPWPPGLDRGQGASVRAEDRPRQVRGDQHLWRALPQQAEMGIVPQQAHEHQPHKTARGAAAMERLTCFVGVPPPFDKKKRVVIPQALRVTHLRPNRKYTVLKDLCNAAGWKYGEVVAKLEEKRTVR